MPLETGTYISDLVVTNPAHADGLNNADAHARLIKAALKSTFPNLTGAVTASQSDLNNLFTSGVSILKDTGVHFATNAFDGLANPSAGKVDIVGKNAGGSASAVVAEFNGVDLSTALKGALDVVGAATIHGNATFAGTLAVTGTLASTGAISGPGTTPVGGMIMWLTDTLPADGNWCWANGGVLSRTTVGAGKELFDLWGTFYGIGDNSTTFNVINMQEVAPVGKSTMGGATSPGLLASIATGVKNVLGHLFGTDTETLDTTKIPAHFHSAAISDPGHTHFVNQNAYWTTGSGGGGVGGGGAFGVPGTTSISLNAAATGVRVNSANGLDNTASTGGGLPHNNIQPTRAVNFIIRIR